MENLNLNEKLQFDNFDLTPPTDFLDNIIDQIKIQTNGNIIGKYLNYKGEIKKNKKTIFKPQSYGLATIASLCSPSKFEDEVVSVNIQNDLGILNKEVFKYELFLTTPYYEQYKFRICFLQNTIATYPVKVVLEQNIADEVNKKGINSNYIFYCNTPTEFENLMLDIFNSKRIKEVMQEIININYIKSHSMSGSHETAE